MSYSVLSPVATVWKRFVIPVALSVAFSSAVVYAFQVDSSPVPSTHPAPAPEQGASVTVNPPSMVWRDDKTAQTYIVELSQSERFDNAVRVEEIAMPFYNHNAVLEPGQWFWRYYVVREGGKVSEPSATRSFVVDAAAIQMPVPSVKELFEVMPQHPRIFVTPETLPAFQQRRHHEGKEAWEALQVDANRALRGRNQIVGRKIPLKDAKIVHSKDSKSHSWKEGDPVRRQVFLLDEKGELFWLPENTIKHLGGAAARLDKLSLAWQISGEERYLAAAREVIALIAPMRLDAHLSDAQRAEHDTVVYAYEQGLKAVALAYDRLYHQLSEAERNMMLEHVAFHADAAGNWLFKGQIHLNYQRSHEQQCMHNLLVTVLAMANDSPRIDRWVRYIVPQYMNRIAWTSEDGGYFEGQTYGHKFAWILEGLAAVRSATGVDLFKKPEIYNAGSYWLYAMNLNYWFQNWGDNYSLIWPHANPRDAYISAFLAAMNEDPYVKWYSQSVLTNPEVSPFDYISATDLPVRPPIDIAQARVFPQTGVVVAYNGLYDHGSERIFFRSSPWGSHSHSHADQNGFVIHSGGEILAPDTGYYTYSGDTYHQQWSKSTFAHNSMLVDGKPQPLGINSKGEIDTFFHGTRATYFVGDASEAYGKPLKTFLRAVLYVRPATYVIYDELAAESPATYSWLLNTFEEPQIDKEQRRVMVKQQQMRMQVDTLLPQAVSYAANNERPHPIKTARRLWSRYTEAFPQPWHLRIENAARSKDEGFLTLLQTWSESDGAREQAQATVQNASSVGLRYTGQGESSVVLFRRKLNGSEAIEGQGVQAQAQSVAVFSKSGSAEGSAELTGWLVAAGTSLKVDAGGHTRELFASAQPVSASAQFDSPVGAALLRVDGRAGQVSLHLTEKPEQIFIAEAGSPAQARSLTFNWDSARSAATFELAADAAVTIWVDPVVNPSAALEKAQLQVHDSAGSYTIELEPAWSELGEVVYFAEVSPREIGVYKVSVQGESGRESATDLPTLFIQDRWDPYSRSSRAVGEVRGEIREGSWLYFSAAPGSTPSFTAQLEAPAGKGQVDDILFNGDFEFGILNYPPRGWTMGFDRTESRTSRTSGTWNYWTQEDAVHGKSALKHVRDSENYRLIAKPMRLLSGGEYYLRFYAKGDIGNASVTVRGSQYRSAVVKIEPSSQWRLYETKVNLEPGYTTVTINTPAGQKDQVLWVDHMEFGKIPNP